MSSIFPFSPAVRNNFRSCHNDYSANDLSNSKIPRHAEQRPGVYEASRGTEIFERTCHGLCRLNVGNDEGIRH